MAKSSSRPSLPTSSTDFALPPSSSVLSTPSSDDHNPLIQRFRRPSLLAPKASFYADSRFHSPLASSSTLYTARRRGAAFIEDPESERMWADSPSSGSSENATPPLGPPENNDHELNQSGEMIPTTPPRNSSSGGSHEPSPRTLAGRLSFPLKTPRILNLLAESHPEEDEVKSEAAFQRLITSGSELPLQPHTPRCLSDRGRYPEEAGQEEFQREETPSDDEEVEDATFAFEPLGNNGLIKVAKPVVTHTELVNVSETSVPMDVDISSASPIISSVSLTPGPNSWRYTPPPTTSALRSNKRKFDDRFDPYPSSSKRRAVSPSVSHLRDSHSSIASPLLSNRTSHSNTRLPIAVPIMIPNSAASSAASSPTISSSSYSTSLSRPVSMTASPTLRASIGLGSPILRPALRSGIAIRRGEDDEKDVEGAGEAVGGLTLG